LVDDAQVLANDYVVELNHPIHGRIKMPGFPVKLDKTPAALRTPAPVLGQHTEEILTQIAGYSPEEIAELKRDGII
jgi:CoA:oxalate CoA-transferase